MTYRIIQPWGEDLAREATIVSEHATAAEAFAEIESSISADGAYWSAEQRRGADRRRLGWPNHSTAGGTLNAPRLMPAGRADLAGVVLTAAALPEQHQARVFGAFRVRRGHKMPASAVRAAQLVARVERRILGGEIADSHPSILAYNP